MIENINRINSIEKLKDLIRIQKTIIDNIPILQYNISPDGIILDCNKLVLKTLGYKNKKDLIGKPLLPTVFAPSYIEKAKKLFLIWKKTGILKNEELQIKTLKGRLIDVLLNVNTLYDKNGKVQGSISTQIDITQYKKAEKEINDLSRFASENPNPIFRVSTKFRIIYVNAPGKIILQKLGLKGKKIPKNIFDTAIASIKKKNDSLMTLELKIGTSIYEFSIVKVKDTDYYSIYGNDITNRKKAEKSEQKIEKEEILLTDRSYIARELHDTVTQTLFSANLIAEALPRLWKKDPKSVIKRLNEIRMLNSVALTEMRSLLFDLRPSSFKNEDLGDLLKELVKFIGLKSKIPISVKIVKKYGYSHRVELSFYRIAKEALNNIAKHSYATKAKLVLKSLPDKITMDIDDDGVGFNTKDTSHENLGLIIMKERAKIIDASLELESNPSKGTKISVVYNNNNNNNYDRKK
jgi:PAS domain S-box-containing protein